MTSFFFGDMRKINKRSLNEKHPAIQFTTEWSQTSINFLDIAVSLIQHKK